MQLLEDKPHYRWIILTLAFLIAFTMHALVFSYAPVIPWIISELSLTHTQAGFMFSICIFSLSFSRIGWGLILDRFALRNIVGLSMALIGLSSILRSYTTTYEVLVVLQLVLGAALGSVLPSLPKLVALWFSLEEEGFATGVYMAGTAVGDMTGLALTPLLMNWTGSWKTTFIIYGLWSLALAVVWWVLAKEPTGRKWSAIRSNVSIMKSLVDVLKMKKVWILTGFFLCSAVCYDTVSLWIPYILQLKGVCATFVGLFSSLLPLGSLLSGPVVGWLFDKVGRRRLIMVILGATSGFMVFLIMIGKDMLLYAAIFLVGFCTVGVLTLTLAIPVGFEDRTLTASAVGIMSSIGNIGTIAMSVVMGYLKDVTGSFLPALALLALIAEGMLVLGLLTKDI